ncbi:YaaA family protein, partial [Hydrogenimonas sp.]
KTKQKGRWMTILFAPSEGKREGGTLEPIDKSAFLFPDLYEKRAEAAAIYRDFVQNASEAELQKLFGVKEQRLLERYKGDIFAEKTMKAVERYDGVAYDYLGYDALPEAARTYLDEHLIIFSNLFGPVKGGDRLPDYKLKQGERIGSFVPERFYKEHFSDALTGYLESRGPVVDLRAGFYEKFYTLPLPHITMKFLKNGKSVSHWAKAYRGTVLKEMAKRAIMDETDLMAMDIENLSLVEIREIKNRKEIVYEITE